MASTCLIGCSTSPVLSPVALFVYNRPWHTQRTIEALLDNELASSSDLYIFSDGPKNEDAAADVFEVRRLARSIVGFRSVTIIDREMNFGLASSIVDGVSRLCKEFGRVIVLEDDLVTSPHFLRFMNEALERYAAEKTVWHISGWNYPINPVGLPDAFFWRAMNCWGWATWSDRWVSFEKNPKRLMATWSSVEIKRFNVNGTHDFWSQITANASGKLNTWAIFWYATIFEYGGFCLNPTKTLVTNIGNDGTGQNCGVTDVYTTKLADAAPRNLPGEVVECQEAVQVIQAFYSGLRGSFLRRVLRRTKRAIEGSIRVVEKKLYQDKDRKERKHG